ncbi:MAG TPA: monofunctional biosynthetic peptidoglycan transglycosylase [Steroidobacteraceae bacterium]|nr:monofunctional biosynthetic peptidoglycan transglycosylase [Steroidobacteraceae bacterium]HRX90958.1 monofunctional biosynthetic peptidoglycan transglycosylase [Steroidobacteraceae bacterium]
MAKRSRRARLLRFAALVAGLLLLATVLPVLMLRWIDPWTSAFMLDARFDAARAKHRDYATHYEWVSLEQIAPHAALAVIAAEDQQFPFHTGFDLKSIRKAIQTNTTSKHVRGASTITQQVAKNLFLWSGRSYVRKGLEAYFTLLIEWLWPKERILEIYLNIAEFGRGVYGVEAAAQRFFRKPAGRLSATESATLAAVLPNPRVLKVERPSPYVLQRRRWILQQMRALGGRSYLEQLDAGAD